jgi:hypothetical protein
LACSASATTPGAVCHSAVDNDWKQSVTDVIEQSGVSQPANRRDSPPSSHGRACRTTTGIGAVTGVFCRMLSSDSGGTGRLSPISMAGRDVLLQTGAQVCAARITRWWSFTDNP